MYTANWIKFSGEVVNIWEMRFLILGLIHPIWRICYSFFKTLKNYYHTVPLIVLGFRFAIAWRFVTNCVEFTDSCIGINKLRGTTSSFEGRKGNALYNLTGLRQPEAKKIGHLLKIEDKGGAHRNSYTGSFSFTFLLWSNLCQYLRGGVVTNNRFVQIISNRKQKLRFNYGESAAIRRQLRWGIMRLA